MVSLHRYVNTGILKWLFYTNCHITKIFWLSKRLWSFSALTLLVGRQEGQWWGAGVVICLEQGAGLHTAQLMPLPLTVSCFSKIQIGFTFLVRYWLTRVDPDKGPLNGCSSVVVVSKRLLQLSKRHVPLWQHSCFHVPLPVDRMSVTKEAFWTHRKNSVTVHSSDRMKEFRRLSLTESR